jgi:hypothetical protein
MADDGFLVLSTVLSPMAISEILPTHLQNSLICGEASGASLLTITASPAVAAGGLVLRQDPSAQSV